MSERCERTSERMSKWPSTLRDYFLIIQLTEGELQQSQEMAAWAEMTALRSFKMPGKVAK